MGNKLTQKQLVLQALKCNMNLTALSAAVELGITQLSARIVELECDGYVISREWVQTPTKKYKRYFLEVNRG